MKKFLSEFKEFALRGNVLDMAIGVVIGGAFGKITTSLVNDVIMPLVGMLIGGIDLGQLDIVLKPAVMNGDEVVTAAVTLGIGTFLTTIIDFILVALVGILYGSLLQRQQMFGILRATGYRQSYLFRAVLAELSVYFAFIVAAMVAVTMLSVTKFAKQVVGQLLLTADYVRLAGQLGWIALGLGAAFMLLAYGVSRSVFRKNIDSCIRFAE